MTLYVLAHFEENLERDVDEWRHLSNLNLDSSVNEQLEHLTAQMRETHLVAQEAAKAISSDSVSYTHLTLPTKRIV